MVKQVENCPSGVEFNFDNICNDCPCCSLEVVNDKLYADNEVVDNKTIIRCKWRKQCKHLRTKLEKRYEES